MKWRAAAPTGGTVRRSRPRCLHSRASSPRDRLAVDAPNSRLFTLRIPRLRRHRRRRHRLRRRPEQRRRYRRLAGLPPLLILDRQHVREIRRRHRQRRAARQSHVIPREAGGDDEEVEIPNRPADLSTTMAQIAEASESLSKKVIDTPRQVVSASVIGKANVLLELIKMVRNFAHP